ncbi:MAG: tetratricopeptide repeat protein [Bacteroidetes bacterium]|nr:tetratricopeptide repeat protein [Bacteroidota bacterium]
MNQNRKSAFFGVLLILLLISPIVKSQYKLPEELQKRINNYQEQITQAQINEEKNEEGRLLNLLSSLYWDNNFNKEAITCFKKSLEINKQIGNKYAIYQINTNIGLIYSDMMSYAQAMNYFNDSYTISKKLKSKPKKASALNNIALTFQYSGKYQKAINNSQEALRFAKETKDIKLIKSCYGIIAENYKKLGNTEKSFEYFNYYSSISKHIQNQEIIKKEQKNQQEVDKMKNITNKAIEDKEEKEKQLIITESDLSNQKELTKGKQLQIDILDKEKKIKELKINEQKAQIKTDALIRNFFIIGFIVVLIFSALLYRLLLEKKKTNRILEKTNVQLKEQKEKIEQQSSLLAEAHKNLKKRNLQILDSISYASRIQDAILPYQNFIRKQLPNSFVFFKPRDIVSGDFYWYSEQNNKIFIAAADCTGHGVPGAFMSMIGNTLLNEIIKTKQILSPSLILERLNKEVVSILNQDSDNQNFQDDGMDISICCIDKDNDEFTIACANSTAYFIEDNNLHTINGDVFSIGGVFSNKFDVSFNNHSFKTNKDSVLYMFSDGFKDQFGGKNNEKFMIGQFEDMLLNIHAKNMDKQKLIIGDTLNDWKGDFSQVDDILIIGVKF